MEHRAGSRRLGWTRVGCVAIAAWLLVGCGKQLEPFVGTARRVPLPAGALLVVEGHTTPGSAVQVNIDGLMLDAVADAEGHVRLANSNWDVDRVVVLWGGNGSEHVVLPVEGPRPAAAIEVDLNGAYRCRGGTSCLLRFGSDDGTINVITAPSGTLISSGTQPPRAMLRESVRVPVELPPLGAVQLAPLFDRVRMEPVFEVPVRLVFPDGRVAAGRLGVPPPEARTLVAKQLEAVVRGPVALTPEGAGNGVVALYARGVFYELELVRNAPTVADIRTVAVIEYDSVVLGSCGRYSNGREWVQVDRIRNDARVTYYDRKTGAQRGTGTVRGPASSCPTALSAAVSTTSMTLGHPAVRAWVAANVPP